ncbi:hypothetical protein chiPu_0019478 [Chiloscyllium punctatum]|uniref:Uncharacterized protein n=1 Tax=Chiloscyllium punctatum TaxID=137246 RepID=A0A401RS07_CHIPU|nr:hypothetical protein [Chiloscyllium punctatum]
MVESATWASTQDGKVLVIVHLKHTILLETTFFCTSHFDHVHCRLSRAPVHSWNYSFGSLKSQRKPVSLR